MLIRLDCRHRTPYALKVVPLIADYINRPRVVGQLPPSVLIHPKWSLPPARPAPQAPVPATPNKTAKMDAASVRDLMLDVVQTDSYFKEEVAAIVREVLQDEMAQFTER